MRGYRWSPLAFFGQTVVGGSCHNNHKMAGPMIPPDILNRKSLYSLLHKIDFEIAEQTRVRRCPIAGGRCTMPTTGESLGAVLLIFMRCLRFAIAYVVVVRAAGAVSCHPRCDSGSAGYTGRRCYLLSPPFAKDKTRTILWRSSRLFSVYGVPPSTTGYIISESFSPRASVTGVWPDT